MFSVASLVAATVVPPEARAAAEVHRLNLSLSAMPTSIDGGDFRRDLDYANKNYLESIGLKGLDRVTTGWMFGAALRYQVRTNLVIDAGMEQLKSQSKREYLPALNQSIQLRYEILTVPVHVGGDYYFQAYNQGDFQARAFLGAGVLSMAMNRVTAQTTVVGPDTLNSPLGGAGVTRWAGFGPGYYAEGGVHMYFASRFSVMISAGYHSVRTDEMYYTDGDPEKLNAQATNLHAGRPYSLDASGVGIKLAIGVGL